MINKMKSVTVAVLGFSVCATSVQAINVLQVGGLSVHSSLMRYAKESGYTHIHWQIHPNALVANDWVGMHGGYNWGGPKSLYNSIRSMHELAKQEGLCLIPGMLFGTRHGGDWEKTNSNILWNYEYNSEKEKMARVPAFAPDPNGIDSTYREILRVANAAYEDANVQSVCPTKYFHLAYDEPYNFGETRTMMARTHPADRYYIASNGDNASAYYKLYASSIKRRVADAMSIMGNGVQIMIWADALDPQSYGGVAMNAWTSAGGDNSISIQTKYALSGTPDIMDVKNNLILVAWWYEPSAPGGFYNVSTTLTWFKNFGMRFMVQPGYGEVTPPGGFYATQYIDAMAKGNLMMHRWVNAARRPEYNGYMLGYVASNWTNDTLYYKPGRYWDGDHNGVLSPRSGWFYMAEKLAKAANFYPEKVDVLSVWTCSGNYCGYTYNPREGTSGAIASLSYADPGVFFSGNIHGIEDRVGAPWPNDVADRIEDVISVTEFSNVATVRNWVADVSGNLAYRTQFAHVLPGNTIKYLKGDVDGDGRTDILHLYQSPTPNRMGLKVYRHVGAPYYGLSLLHQNNNIGGNGYLDILTGDMNGDGMTDIYQFWNNSGSLGVEVYASKGNSISLIWSTAALPSGALGGSGNIRFFVEDFDGDGDTDIYHLKNNSGRLRIDVYRSNGNEYIGSGGGHTAYASNLDVGGAGNASDYYPADLDGDGKMDILSVWNNLGNLAVGLKKATGTTAGFTPIAASNNLGPFISGSTFRAADINGDGRTDLIEFKDTGTYYRIRTFVSTGTALVPYGDVYNYRGGAVQHVLTMDTKGN